MQLILLALAVSLMSAAMVHAEYYTYVDDQGNIHYTDNPSSVPAKTLKRAKRVDVYMGPEKKAAPADPDDRDALIDRESRPLSVSMKRAKKAFRMSGVPPAKAPVEMRLQPSPPSVADEPADEAPDPALSTPLKTIRHFRRSLARMDYAAAATCLRGADPREVQGFLAQMPKEFSTMLSEEFSPAVEIVRDDSSGVYMIGDPSKQGNKIMRRYKVYLERVGSNWKITH